jgi:two-component system cell cycle sensor histidine kinase/response regulator CckA
VPYAVAVQQFWLEVVRISLMLVAGISGARRASPALLIRWKPGNMRWARLVSFNGVKELFHLLQLEGATIDADRGQLLADLSSALAQSSAELADVLDAAARAAAAAIGGYALVRVVNDAGLLSTSAVHGPGPDRVTLAAERLMAASPRADEGLSGRLAATGLPIVNNAVTLEQINASMPVLRSFLEETGIQALMLLPLIAHGSYLGLLGVSRSADRPFADADVLLGTDIAAQIALAVATARSVQRLRLSESRYRRIVETSIDGMWEGDRNAITTFVNERTTEMLGYTREEMLGQPISRFLGEHNRDGIPGRLAARMEGIGEQYEARLTRADGTSLWVDTRAVPLRDEAGTVIGSFSTFSDITDRVRARELEAQLQHINRLDSLGQLAGGVAHNFNNLLTVISGCTQLLAGLVPAGGAAGQLVAEIAGAAERGSSVTRQLLAVGRSQAGRAEPLGLDDLLADLASLLRLTVGDHIQLVLPRERAPGERRAWVRADRGHLEQVIINLAANARDAMEAGGTLTIEYDHTLGIRPGPGLTGGGQEGPPGPGEDPRWYVRLAVSDTGCGMDADTLRRAFEPFFTTKDVHRGTGLGLASVYGTIREAGGEVSLRSEIGAGTVVDVYLPATDAQPHTESHPEPGSRPELAPALAAAGHGGHGLLMLVEDEPAVAGIVRRLLEEAGYEVVAPGGAQQALQAIGEGQPVDLLITDVMMPGMTGPELSRRVHVLRARLPVLFISGYTAGALEDFGRLDAGIMLLEKPFTREALLGTVATLLGSREHVITRSGHDGGHRE